MKRSVFAGLTAMLILSTAVTAQAAHTHEYTRQDSKVYVCECGKEKPLYSLKGERVITLNCNGGSLYGGIYKTVQDGDEFEFAESDLLIETASREGFVSASDYGVTVVMDTRVTPELLAEGVERELISKIQSMRKEAGFEVTDRITVNYVTDDAGVKNALEKGKDLKTVVLADSIAEGDADGFRKDLDINGAACTVIVNKAAKR